MKGTLRYLPSVLVLAAGVALWQALTVALRVPDFLLPGPSAIWKDAVSQHRLLLDNTWPTLEIAVAGFGLALVLGVGLAIAIHYSSFLHLAIYPIVVASQTVPLLALAPILVVLLGFTIVPKLVVVCLICFFPIAVNMVDGLHSVDPDLRRLMRTFGAGRWQLLRHVEFPGAMPYLFSGMKVAVAYSVVGALFGEWVGSSQGLGWIMEQAQAQFDTEALFAAMIILTAIGLGLFALVSVAERLLLPWYHDERRSQAR
ncbi:MAG: ABC transporter permease [Chloroflexota bacterium]